MDAADMLAKGFIPPESLKLFTAGKEFRFKPCGKGGQNPGDAVGCVPVKQLFDTVWVGGDEIKPNAAMRVRVNQPGAQVHPAPVNDLQGGSLHLSRNRSYKGDHAVIHK